MIGLINDYHDGWLFKAIKMLRLIIPYGRPIHVRMSRETIGVLHTGRLTTPDRLMSCDKPSPCYYYHQITRASVSFRPIYRCCNISRRQGKFPRGSLGFRVKISLLETIVHTALFCSPSIPCLAAAADFSKAYSAFFLFYCSTPSERNE